MICKNRSLLVFSLVLCVFSKNVSSSSKPQNVQEFRPISNHAPTWKIEFDRKLLNITMKETQLINFTLTGVDTAWGDDFKLNILTDDNSLLNINDVNYVKNASIGSRAWSGNFNATGVFLGRTKVFAELKGTDLVAERSTESLNAIILRKESIWDDVFVAVIGSIIMMLYVNFGAALELNTLKGILLRPIGPAIGLVGQFLVMPLLSFIIGYFLFNDMPELRLGLFFTGSTPGGGLSNIFTVILNANLNLSIIMTAVSNFAAFAMMPLWIFTLGTIIFKNGNIPVPYKRIAIMSFSLLLPLGVGIAIQKIFPKVAQILVKMLKPIATLLAIAVFIFGVTNNSYMFTLWTWRIIIGSCALPWCGYLIGWSMGILFGQSKRDSLTIAIETGIQNSGIAIFMCLVTLPQPQADMTSTVPVAATMMTPIPLLGLYLIKKFFYRESIDNNEGVPNREAMNIEIAQIMAKKPANRAANYN